MVTRKGDSAAAGRKEIFPCRVGARVPCHRCARTDTRPDTATPQQSGPGLAHGTAHTPTCTCVGGRGA